MAAGETKPLIEPLRVDTRVMREQLDQFAAFGARFRNGPLHHLFADAAAAAMTGDADILEQAARGALRAQSRQDAELQAADDGALVILGDHELEVRVALYPLERVEIGLRQRLFKPFPLPPERIVRQQGNDNADVVAAGTTDGDLPNGCHGVFR